VNDCVLTEGSCFTLQSSNATSATLTGFTGGVDGRLLVLLNRTGSIQMLAHDVDSVDVNRLCLPAATVAINVNGSATFVYAGTKWNLISSN
jgi:hypothetical protein